MREDFNRSFLCPRVQMAWVSPARLGHFGNLLPILDEQMSDWRSSWECFFPPPPAHLTFQKWKENLKGKKEEVWGLNNLLTDSIPLQKLGILLA